MKRDWILLAVAVALAWGWVKSYGDKREADALADARGDSLNAALASVDTITGRLALADSALRVHEAQDRAHARIDRQRETVARARADSTALVLDSVIASLPDTTPLVIAITNEREAGAACRLAVMSCEALTLTLTREVANRDSVVALLEPALARTRELWAAAEKRSRPGILGRLRIALPFMALGVLGWELAR